MDEYVCKNCTQWFEQWGGIYFPACPYCHSRHVVRMTRHVALSEYREHEYMRIRLRRWDVRVQRLYEGGYLPQAVYDAYHELTDIPFFDWYHIALPTRAASLHPKRRYDGNPPFTSVEPPRNVPRQYEPYTLVCLRFAPNTPGE